MNATKGNPMKLLFALALVALCLSIPVFAQTSPPPTPDPTIQNGLQQIVDAIGGSATNWYFTGYGIYAPKLAQQWGGGGALLYKINNNFLIGPRMDYVNGGFEMITGNVTFQVPLQPAKNIAPWLWVTPFIYVGAGSPISGPNKGNMTGITGAGGEISLYRSANGFVKLGLVGDIEKWTGFEGQQYRIGPLLNINF
jgi:hypothetical protein